MTDRVRDGALEVPTLTFRHDDTGNTITLIGVKHVASHAFWQNLQRDVDLVRPPAQVHYELPTPGGSAGRITRLKLRLVRVMSESQDRMVVAAGHAPQFAHLQVRPEWRNHDLPRLTVIGAFRLPILALIAPVIWLLSRNSRVAGACGKALIRGLYADAGSTPSIGALVRTTVIQDHRNAFAAKAALTTPSDVTLIWGHAHLRGIGEILERAGFRAAQTEWRALFAGQNSQQAQP
ncbi:hypothetical protein [Salinibacterium sp. ZJ450]|uniref:hypothetical protein n=1 Tax=Salinibacterium sp. ZJ450 TaxID=2708338 RepID=UPI001420DB4C|nr:hypothetical protein [Salinibacterium sp. ZJ450]